MTLADPADFERLARILKVDHAGEHGAIHIYSAQIAFARWRYPDLVAFLVETIGHEREHRARLAALMVQRCISACPFGPLWGAGGYLLGGMTACMGRRAILICTRAVESCVHGHLEAQIAFAGDRDTLMASELASIQVEEQQHLDFAADGLGALGRWDRLLDRLVRGITETLIRLATR